MNIAPEFRTSIQWKKFRNALKHPSAMEVYVNLCCELEGITRRNKKDTGHLGTDCLEDLYLMSGADEIEGIEAEHLEQSLLASGIMQKDDEGYRLITWEEHNANLISCRRNARKGGRKKASSELKVTEVKVMENELNKLNELNVTERNRTGGLTHGKPRVVENILSDIEPF
jgi:hypothetical protein